MKKRRSVRVRGYSSDKPIGWLPVDSRLFPFISCGHVRGMARVFLMFEMALAVIVVFGTLSLVILKLFY